MNSQLTRAQRETEILKLLAKSSAGLDAHDIGRVALGNKGKRPDAAATPTLNSMENRGLVGFCFFQGGPVPTQWDAKHWCITDKGREELARGATDQPKGDDGE